MFGNIFEQMNTYECFIEIERNGSIQRQKIQAPRAMIEQTFLGLAQEASQLAAPMRIKVSRPFQVYDQFDKVMLNREASIEVMNRFFTNKEK